MIEHELDWEPDPPSAEQRQADERQRHDAWMVTSYFARAASGCELARTTSDAMYNLECAINRGSRLTDCDDARALLAAIATVRALVMLRYPQWNHDELADGINAAIGQTLFYHADPVDRARWRKADLADLGDLARRLRNTCHSAALFEQMQSTRARYRDGKIDGMCLVHSLRRDAERIARNDEHNAEISRRLAHHRGAVAGLIPMVG